MNWSEITALKKAGESRTKLRTSKLCMVTQERGEKKQVETSAWSGKLQDRPDTTTSEQDSMIYVHQWRSSWQTY